MSTTITVHSAKDVCGNRYQYARIIEQLGLQTIGSSVLLHRLSPEQQRIAKPVPLA